MPDALVIRGARQHDEDSERLGQPPPTRTGGRAQPMKPAAAETPYGSTGRFLAPLLGM